MTRDENRADELTEAHRVLVRSARAARDSGQEYWQWLDSAPQWALDTVSQREVDAVVAYVFGVE